jgi:hypothetical protein
MSHGLLPRVKKETRAVTVSPARAVALAAILCGCLTTGMSAQGSRFPMPFEPIGNANEAIFPAFEGWGENKDGDYFIVMGYMNRNRTQTVEIPVGPNNRIEPGGPDYGQPTVFEPGRQTTVFAIRVPKDFGNKKLTWTLVANGQSAVVTFYLNREYNMNFYKEESNGNEPPQMKLGPNDPMASGPAVGFARTLTGAVGVPVPLEMWASDAPPTEKNWESIVAAGHRKPVEVSRDQVAIVDGRVLGGPRAPGRGDGSPATPPDITAVWTKMRGPGVVTVQPSGVPMVTNGKRDTVVEAKATASFSAPGEYVLRAEPVEADDGFDGLCCFTFANVKVIVK